MGNGYEVTGYRGMDSKPFRKSFKTEEARSKWIGKNDEDISITAFRDPEPETLPAPIGTGWKGGEPPIEALPAPSFFEEMRDEIREARRKYEVQIRDFQAQIYFRFEAELITSEEKKTLLRSLVDEFFIPSPASSLYRKEPGA